ncbi:MAG: methyltransferase domain-containing protein [Thiohalophilus sp.]|uniref:SAM-dependent methyltransferase n=1 Tax=Thiohalophilus sp. TaxID=3028392 RepID=UPI0028704A84|nr:methyltransferase domain-containing protein [Thiohalophilus sp.]MDR9436629.1 methyltransferase domain-containing protein [Thiohalophilus sp.]
MSKSYSDVVETARDYYNSEDADNFYFHVWGGEDIHIGLYESGDEPIRDASLRTVEHIASKLQVKLDADKKVLDMGAGYGGVARYLAKNYGCKVVALNLSERENERDRKMNQEQGLDHLIEVWDGSFESVEADDASFDVVWSQDSILHSSERGKVIAEAARVLKPGGELIFTDPMQVDDCPEGVLQPVYDRIHLPSLGSIEFYRQAAKDNGLEEIEIEVMTENLVKHYGRVRRELEENRDSITDKVSDAYIDRMITGLGHWVEAGSKGYLRWGILHFRKPA